MHTRDSILRGHSLFSKMARNYAVGQTCDNVLQSSLIIIVYTWEYPIISSKLVMYRKKTRRLSARWVVQLKPSMFILRLRGTIIRYARICPTNIVNLQSLINVVYEWVPIKQCANRRRTMKKFLDG